MTSAPVKRTRVSESDQPPPIALSEAQMCALLAASHPLPPASRSAFLVDVARELAALREIGDGTVHRVVMVVQRRYFDPPLTTHPPQHHGKYERG